MLIRKTRESGRGIAITCVGMIGFLFLFASKPICAQGNYTLDGGTDWLSGNHTYDVVRIINGATLYIDDYDGSSGGKLRINANKVYIDPTSRIIGNGGGYRGGDGSIRCNINPGEDGEDTNGGPAQNRANRLGGGEGGDATSNSDGAGGGGAGYVIDSISSIELMIDKEFDRKENAIKLCEWLSNHECTSLIIAESQQAASHYVQHGVMEFVVDGVIALYNIRQGNTRVNALEILKMKGTKHDKSLVPFNFENGISIFPQEQVFTCDNP